MQTADPQSLELTAEAAGAAPLLAARAQILVVFLDCNSRLAHGVVATPDESTFVDEMTKPYYPQSGDQSTANGFFAVFNAAPGCHELQGAVGDEEIYRTRLYAAEDVFTIAFAYPKSVTGDLGYPCAPGSEP